MRRSACVHTIVRGRECYADALQAGVKAHRLGVGRAVLVLQPVVVDGETPGFPSALGYRDVTVRARWGSGAAEARLLLIYC